MDAPFLSLYTERNNRRTYLHRDEATADVFDYIELFYTFNRRHYAISYVSATDFNLTSDHGFGLCPQNRQ